MGSYASERAAKRIAELRGRGLDLVSFWCEARDAIASAVPYHMTPCWFTLIQHRCSSPAITTTATSGSSQPNGSRGMPDDFDLHSLADIARSKAGVSTLHEVTGGDPSRSRAWREYVQPYGAEQQLGLALRRQSERRGGCSPSTVNRALSL